MRRVSSGLFNFPYTWVPSCDILELNGVTAVLLYGSKGGRSLDSDVDPHPQLQAR